MTRKCKITVMRVARYDDLIAKYENPISNACDMRVGQIFWSDGNRPRGFCKNAWETLFPFVDELLRGGGRFYGDWMKDSHSAMLSCNDGFRPVSFLIQAVDDNEA